MFIAMRSDLLQLTKSHAKDWKDLFPPQPPQSYCQNMWHHSRSGEDLVILFYVQEDSDAVMNSISKMGQQSKTEKALETKLGF